LPRASTGDLRFFREVAPASRQACTDELADLAAVKGLSDAGKAALEPIVRRMCIEDVAYSRLPLRPLHRAIAIGLPAVILAAGSFLFVYLSTLDRNPQWALAYVAGYGVSVAVILWGGDRFKSGYLELGLAYVGLAIYLVCDNWPRWDWQPWVSHAGEGLFMGGLVVIFGEMITSLAKRYLFLPAMLRGTRSCLNASDRVAVRLAGTLTEIAKLPHSVRRPLDRRRVFDLLNGAAKTVERAVPWEMWAAGATRMERVAIRRRCRHAAAEIRDQARIIIENPHAGRHDRACEELWAAAIALAGGDWSKVMQDKLPARGVRGWLTIRKTPVAFFVAAAGLHFLPESPPGMQIALVAAGVLALLKTDSGVQDRIVQTYQEAGKP
jgi:hypothetical protein